MNPWRQTHRAEYSSRLIANRHYNRQKPGAPQFVPPGRCLVLRLPDATALWVTSWPFPEYVKHRWPGAWVCSTFRREDGCPHRASDLIQAAVAATVARWPDVPAIGMVTFIDRDKVRPTMVRDKPVWGWTYRKAGFVDAGETAGGLLALQLWPAAMPVPEAALAMNGQLVAWQ